MLWVKLLTSTRWSCLGGKTAERSKLGGHYNVVGPEALSIRRLDCRREGYFQDAEHNLLLDEYHTNQPLLQVKPQEWQVSLSHDLTFQPVWS